MYINKRFMAGALKEDAIQHPAASNGNIPFTFLLLQPRPTRFRDGTSGIITERTWCRFWCPASSQSYHAGKLREGASVIVEGTHNITKRKRGDEVVTYHELELSGPPQYAPKGKTLPYVNRQILVGNLGRDAKFFSSDKDGGNTKVVFSTASTRYRRSSDGQGSEETMWFDHVLFVPPAAEDRYRKLLTQGAMVWVEGRHDVIKKEIEGVARYFPEILIRDVKKFPAESTSEEKSPQDIPSKAERPRAESEHKSAFQPASFE